MKIGIVSFSLSACLLAYALLDFVGKQARPDAFPLPPVGVSTKAVGTSADGGDYRVTVDVASPIETLDRPDAPEILCTIEVASVSGGKRKILVRSELEAFATYYAGQYRIYTTDTFGLSAGDFDLEVKNLGCANGDAFKGGSAHIRHVGPVRLSYGLPPYLLGFLFGVIGVLCLVVMAIKALPFRSPREAEHG